MIKPGDLVKDKITGFEGIVVARTEWLYQCVRISVQPQSLHDGKPIDCQTFDEEQLEVLEERKFFPPLLERAQQVWDKLASVTGGDQIVKDMRHKDVKR